MANTENIITFPLYHGTSSLFLPLIKENGLGGKNLIEELQVLPSLECLVNYFKVKEPEIAMSAIKILGVASNIQEQVKKKEHVNVFVTPSFVQARGYAQKNEMGSEVFSKVKSLYGKVNVSDRESINSIINNDLLKVLQSDSFPIVFEINNLTSKDLVTEIHSSVEADFEDIIDIYSNPSNHLEHILMGYNFILKKPVPFNQLKFLSSFQG